MSPVAAPVPAPAPAPPGPPAAADARWRRVTAAFCIVLAAVLTTPAALAYWGQRTLNDTQRYVATVTPLVDSPEVQAAIATRVTNAIEKQVDVEGVIDNVFSGVITNRPNLQLLVGPIAAAVNGLIERQVQEFVSSSAFRDLWVAANTRAQQALHRVLTGQGTGAVTVQGDQLVLDVTAVIDAVKQRLVARGLTFLNNVPIPTTQRQIVLLDAPQLKQVRTIYAFANPVAKWLLWVVVALYFVGFMLARRKPRAGVVIGLVIVANALLLAFALSVGRQLFVNQLEGTVFGPASTVFYETLLSYLMRGRKALTWIGVVLVLVGWFAGAHRSGDAARRSTAGVLESTGASLAVPQISATTRWIAANALWLRIGSAVLGVVVLMWGNQVSPTRVFWSVVLVGVLMVIIQLAVGAARGSGHDVAETPSPPPPAAPAVT